MEILWKVLLFIGSILMMIAVAQLWYDEPAKKDVKRKDDECKDGGCKDGSDF